MAARGRLSRGANGDSAALAGLGLRVRDVNPGRRFAADADLLGPGLAYRRPHWG